MKKYHHFWSDILYTKLVLNKLNHYDSIQNKIISYKSSYLLFLFFGKFSCIENIEAFGKLVYTIREKSITS